MTYSVRNLATFCLFAMLAGSAAAQDRWADFQPTRRGSAWDRPGIGFQAMSAGQQAAQLELVDRSPFGVSLSLQQMGIPESVYDAWLQRQHAGGIAEGAQDEGAESPAGEFILPEMSEVSQAGLVIGLFESSRPSWTVTQEVVLLKRSVAAPQDLLFAPTSILNTTDLPFSFEGGPRISVIHSLDGGCGLEFNYFGIDAWGASAVGNGNAGSPLVIFPPGTLVSTQFAVEYGSELYSAEANLRYQWREALDLLAGFRYAELQEDFSLIGPSVAGGAVPSYATRAGNYLYGFQIGATARVFDRGPLLCVDSFFKTGIFSNHAHQQTATVHNLGIPRRAGDRGNNAAFLGEAGITAVWRLGEHWGVRAGYQVMWIEGVALAPDQIPHTNLPILPAGGASASLDTGGSVFYHGCHLGFEVQW